MKRRIYWGLGALIIVLLCVATFLLLRNTDTSPEKVYIVDRAPSPDENEQVEGPIQDTLEKSKTPAAKPGYEIAQQNAEKPITNATSVTKEAAATDGQTGVAAENTETAEVRVSPYGFGPYPEVPEGAPLNPFDGNETRDMELLKRTVVKAWNEGERFEGGIISGETGKVYLYYPNVIYVTYSEDIDEETGKAIVSISGIVAGASLSQEVGRSVLKGNIPTGYTLIDYDEAGIDPYDYLNLTE